MTLQIQGHTFFWRGLESWDRFYYLIADFGADWLLPRLWLPVLWLAATTIGAFDEIIQAVTNSFRVRTYCASGGGWLDSALGPFCTAEVQNVTRCQVPAVRKSRTGPMHG